MNVRDWIQRTLGFVVPEEECWPQKEEEEVLIGDTERFAVVNGNSKALL